MRMVSGLAFAPVLFLLTSSPAFSGEADLPAPASRPVAFEKDVQPILSRACLSCHGPEKQKGGLRLDRHAEALAGGGSGPAFEAGKSATSLMIGYVAGVDPTTVMPPKGDRLSKEDVGILRAWIDQGAVWDDAKGTEAASGPVKTASDHWAFQPVRRPDAPKVGDAEAVRNPIDAFIVAKLEAAGIKPSPEADRATLIRRLSLDLLGLPPTPGEVDAFVADTNADAYERLVDRTLNSPHYGERWGRHWLDLARYADSDGYEKDSPRPNAWRYRNWVIEALNRDLPFDQFTIDQIAGDLVPDADAWSKRGTGLHRNTLTNLEGGIDVEEYRVKAVVDRVNTTGTVWLGLTVGCAQCHTHKYDPLLHKEYYGLFAFFNSQKEDTLSAPLPHELVSHEQAKADFHARKAGLTKARDDDEREGRLARQEKWETSLGKAVAEWRTLVPTGLESVSKATKTVLPDGSVSVTGDLPEQDIYTITCETGLARLTAIRLEALTDPGLPAGGPGRSDEGNFVLTGFRVEYAPKADPGARRDLKIGSASADFSQNELAVGQAIDADVESGWAIGPEEGRRHAAVFTLKEPAETPGGGVVTITLFHQHKTKYVLGRFRLSATDQAGPRSFDGIDNQIAAILAVPRESRTADQCERLAAFHRTIDRETSARVQAVSRQGRDEPKVPTGSTAVLVEEKTPRKTTILIRGDFLRPGAEVKPGTPAVLPPIDAKGPSPGRLDLAKWLVDPANPLPARVTVNRVWQHLFGRGLVTTLDDFGTRGDRPSHPELLDWLASEFVVQGWSQKKLIRTIVTSATYRQSSKARPELAEVDANNINLARQNRLRLEAEVLRDVTLASSGLLTPVVGGPSVRPPQPSGITDLTYGGGSGWVDSQGPDRYRRGLYTWFQRTSPYPMLMTFDAPDSNVCVVRRERSNTPLQALTLLNDAPFFECAQALGLRVADLKGADTASRASYLFKLCVARPPTASERAVLLDLYAAALAQFRDRPNEAKKLAGDAPRTSNNLAENAAWVTVARAILNLDEFVTRE